MSVKRHILLARHFGGIVVFSRRRCLKSENGPGAPEALRRCAMVTLVLRNERSRRNRLEGLASLTR